jgi:uncharacterized coiled-coil protein SlyX
MRKTDELHKAEGRIAFLEERLSEKTEALEHMNKQLAPFFTLANEQFPRTPINARLDPLLERITAVVIAAKTAQGRRYLDAAGIERIKAKLENAPALNVEIGGMWDDPESRTLAEELRALFESVGFKVRKLAQYPGSAAQLRGVSIFSKSQFDDVLGDAIGQIFAEILQQPIPWVAWDLAGTPKPGEPEPDIKIIVGPK